MVDGRHGAEGQEAVVLHLVRERSEGKEVEEK